MKKDIYDDDIYDDVSGNRIDYEEAYRRQLQRYNELSNASGYDEDDDYDEDFDEDTDEQPQYVPPKKKSTQQRKSASTYERKRNVGQNFGSHKEDKNKKKKKKTSPVKKFFIILILLLLVVFVLLQLLIWRYIGDINTVSTGQRGYTDGSMESDDVLNILLIGLDSRSMEERGRTDSMILLSIDKAHNRTTMTSFMRDCYVTFPNLDNDGDGTDDKGKLNAANVYGGAELLLDTIEYNFDISVDKYFYVDFFSFAKIVDAVGGIELDISDEEAEGMRAPMAEQNKIFENKQGTDFLERGGNGLLVNGNQALAYARLRYVGNADFERTERQRTVITKIIEKAKTLSPIELDRFMETSLSALTTNYTQTELYRLSYRVPFIMGYEVVSQRIPEDDKYTYGDHDVGSTLDIDFDAAKEKLRSSIYG